jgi:CRISPR type III-B/RAMP module-associated protein Cmr3
VIYMPNTSSQTIGLLLRPIDHLFFRDARPFGLRESGQSTLPTPESLFGAIKTHLMRQSGLKPADLHGLHQSTSASLPHYWLGRMQVRGPWLYREKDSQTSALGPLVAAPADLAKQKSGGGSIERLRPLSESPPHWRPVADGLLPMWSSSDAALTPVAGWLDNQMLATYLCGGKLQSTVASTDLFTWHDRTGIGIDMQTATAAEGAIYSTRSLALAHGVCFYAELVLPAGAPAANDLFPVGLSLPWGGEARRASVELLPKPHNWPSATPVDGRVLSLLITPGIFSNKVLPWRPKERGTLISASVRPPLPISGWDLAGAAEAGRHPGPKPTRFAVPAGAVYLWKRSHQADGDPPPVDNLADRPRDIDAGWGVCLTGTWKYHDDSNGAGSAGR